MLVGDPTLPEITVTISQLLWTIGISLNIAGAFMIIKFYRKKRNEKKKS